MIAPAFVLLVALLAAGAAFTPAQAQEPAPRADTAEINLRKEIGVREFQGRQISGEERQIRSGDSLWRILVEEKGVPGIKFRSYLVVIRGLNPQIRNLDVLRAGDKIFIPIRLGDVGEIKPRSEAARAEVNPPASGGTVNYKVKAGDTLYRILREQYKISDDRKVAQYASLVRDLNPQRNREWDTLYEGEIIRLPAASDQSVSAKKDSATGQPGPAPASVPPVAAAVSSKPILPARSLSPAEQAMRSPARENMDLFVKVVQATGNEVELNGEEVVALADGNLRFDRNAFPVVVNTALRQKVVIDPDGKIPASLKAKLNDPRVGTPVVPIANGVNMGEALRQLLIGIGYQPLPNDRPVVVQEAGVAFEAKGSWMALAPAVSNKTQEVLVVNLTEQPNEIPEYLLAALKKQGLYLRDVVLPHAASPAAKKPVSSPLNSSPQIIELPKDKREIIDALLSSLQIPFSTGQSIPVELRAGLRVDTRIDRVFDLEGKRVGIFFRAADPEIRRALQERHGMTTIDLAVDKLSSREIIARLLTLLGDPAVYSEHRFAAAEGATPDRLTVKAWGFNLKKKAMFVTDRQIPPALHRFFFEKGLEIVYFQ
jgi:LysM domain-containing protein